MLFDPRISQVRKIVEAIIAKSMFEWTKVLVTETNTLVIILSDTLLYQIPLKGITDSYPPVAFIYSKIYKFEDENACINDEFLAGNIAQTLNSYNNMSISCPIVAQNSDLRTDEKFEELVSLTSGEGLKYYRMTGVNPNNTFLIPMFSGFISLNKQDTIGMTVYDIHGGFLLLRMNIFKKKINREMIVDCRIINI